MSEIVRAGIISVDQGQTEAAQALGMTRVRVMRRIVLPQAMRVILPPTGNETISMLKTSSLASIATVGELFYVQEQISNATFDIVELARRRQHLVPGDDVDPHLRPVLPRAVFRARLGAPAAARLRCSDSAGCSSTSTIPPPTAAVEPTSDLPPRTSRGHRDGDADGSVPRAVHKCFGRLEVLRGIDLEVAPTRGAVHRRPVRLRQEHVPPLHQPSREDRRRPAVRGR